MVLDAEATAGTNGFSIDPKCDRRDVDSMSKPIVIFTIGTQGDIRPCVALGQGLQRAGYQVRIATSANFAELVREAGLEFYAGLRARGYAAPRNDPESDGTWKCRASGGWYRRGCALFG